MTRGFILSFGFLIIGNLCFAQSEIAKVVSLDEFVVSAGLDGFDVEDFIEQVKTDTTFYQAFLNMRYFPHDISGAIVVYEKDESEKGTMKRQARQFLSTDETSWIDITYEETNGKIKKRNGDWRYLTAEMYDDVFFPSGRSRVNNTIQNKEQELVSGSKLEKHQAQLKRMLFNPGAEIDNVPFIGDKMAIFDDNMVPFYNYSIYTYNWADTVPCIVFSCYTKEGMEKETVIRDMTSYFHRDTKEVIAREYRLAHSTIIFDFDISIKVENTLVDGWILPVNITYNGWWNVPLKKPEIVSFKLKAENYVTEAGRYVAEGR